MQNASTTITAYARAHTHTHPHTHTRTHTQAHGQTHKPPFTLLGGAGSFLNHMFSDAYIQSVPRDAQVPANTIEIRFFHLFQA